MNFPAIWGNEKKDKLEFKKYFGKSCYSNENN